MRRPSRWLRFVRSTGGQMGRYGEKTATFRAGRSEAVRSLGFQFSDVQKPLAVVRRIAEKGNLVHFWPRDEDNFTYPERRGSGDDLHDPEGGSRVIAAATWLMSRVPRGRR